MQGATGRRFRLGLFVLGTGGLFVALLGFILQNSFDGDRVSYFVMFDQNVKGMVIGSKVNFQGVPIGVVKDIRFQQGRTLVEALVDPTRATIQDVTRARLDRLLVTGQVTVEFEGHARDGKALRPGSFVEAKQDPLHTLTASLPDVVTQAVALLQRLDATAARVETLLGDDNQRMVGAILRHVERATEPLAQQAADLQGRLGSTIERANGALMAVERAADGLAACTGEEAQGLLQESRLALVALQRLEQQCAATAREAASLFGGLRSPALATLGSLRATMDDLRSLARQLRLAPDSLLFGVAPAAPGGGER